MISDLTTHDSQGDGLEQIHFLDSLGNAISFNNDLDLIPLEQFAGKRSPEKGNQLNL